MSNFLNSIFKVPSTLRLISPLRYHNVIQAQNLFTTTSLGIDGYVQSRKKTKEQFGDLADKFRVKMTEFVDSPKNMIFTEDLKNMTHIAEPTDIELVLKMIKKFNTQKTEFRFGSFVFGPILMRMFHFLDAPKEALTCFLDPDNKGFFDQLMSFQILLDLLYTHQMYDEMFEVFEIIQKKQVNMTKYPKYVVVLMLAACYKLNTPKSFQYATQMWSEMISTGIQPVRRSTTFMAGLALNQHAPHIALESLSQQKPHYITIRNIKAMALADMDRIDDALPILRGVLEVDRPDQQGKHTFFEETLKRVKDGVARVNDKHLTNEFEKIEKALRDRNLVDQQTLDQLLTSDITLVINQNKQGMPRMPYNRRQNKHTSVIP
ncbi:pentatricopeptide repeat-containing protein 2, mitochondrial-like [Aricia agestis]|uniref:pentatricopeptide repeat-containing protein 2, mitochondrial-like n=1 Tax=Aricia agestis TaxID=91739 RepID=UPI001C205701|nr:pentatricopeptide repeat-containing protein 2, mitochondrial-like [Aricia agestis]